MTRTSAKRGNRTTLKNKKNSRENVGKEKKTEKKGRREEELGFRG